MQFHIEMGDVFPEQRQEKRTEVQQEQSVFSSNNPPTII
jgi:hypothetical protein